MIWGLIPDAVRGEIVPTLAPTNYGPADLAEWRKGYEHATRKTPRGYFGQPAEADPARGPGIIAAKRRASPTRSPPAYAADTTSGDAEQVVDAGVARVGAAEADGDGMLRTVVLAEVAGAAVGGERDDGFLARRVDAQHVGRAGVDAYAAPVAEARASIVTRSLCRRQA